MRYFQHNSFGVGTSEGPVKDCGQMQIKVNFKGLEKIFLYPWAIEQGILQEIDEPIASSSEATNSLIPTDALKSLLQKYVVDFMSKKDLDFVVSPSIPVVWFGDIEKYQRSPKRILTIALNPSLKEFPQLPALPRFKIVDFSGSDAIDALYTTLNHYFYDNPYNWFDKYNRLMSVLNCSYGGKYGDKSNTAIHIDIYTAIATDPTFGPLTTSQKALIQNTSLFNELFDLLNPDVTLISVNQVVFGQNFGDWNLTHTFPFPGGKIKGYTKQNNKLIFGTNCRGLPFGGIPESDAKNAIATIAGHHTQIDREELLAKIAELKAELAKLEDSES